MNKFRVVNFGIAFSIAVGLYMLSIGLTAAFWDWGTSLVEVLSSVYIGYNASVGGAVIGAAWGLIDGFIAGVIIAWIYNTLN